MSVLSTAWLRELTELPGGPGDESQVRDFLARSLYPYVDSLQIDRMGNLLAFRRGESQTGLRVVVSAHMDEVVFFINEIDSDGLLRVVPSGGVNLRTLLGKAVQVGPERLPGVIGWKPVHFSQNGNEYQKVPDIDDVAVDIGAADQAAAEAKVKIGQRIAFQTPFQLMGLPGDRSEEGALPLAGRISGKAFDNRLGCAILTTLLTAETLPIDVQGVFTVQEEIGLRGALVAGQQLEPDVVFILEGTVSDDLPGLPGDVRTPTTRLGEGPALTQRDRSHVVHPPLLQHLLQTAQRENIPCQFKQPNVGGTDAAGFASYRGIPVGIISVPCRYIHGPVAVAELSDFHHAIALLRASLPGLERVSGVIARQPAT